MKILTVNDYGYFMGGAEIYAHDLARSLSLRGHDVRWLTSSSRGGGSLRVLSRDIKPFHEDYFCHGVTARSALARGLQQIVNPSAVRTLRKALSVWKPEIVHLHGFLGRLSPQILRTLEPFPTIATLHNYRAICPKGTKARPDFSLCETPWGWNCVSSHCLPVSAHLQEGVKRALWGSPLAPITRILSPSRFMKRVVERETALPIDHFPCATDLHEYRKPKHNGKARLLYAGRLAKTKGVDILLSAMVAIARQLPDVSLAIAGDGPERSALENQARELALAGRVRFVGHCGKSELASLHAESDLSVVPSLWPENSPLTVLESLALGTPVVASAVGGVSELLIDRVHGRLVPPGSPERLAEALAGLLVEPRLRVRMEEDCRLAAEAYRLDRAVERLERIYVDTVERGNA